jgi:hypothetical protein
MLIIYVYASKLTVCMYVLILQCRYVLLVQSTVDMCCSVNVHTYVLLVQGRYVLLGLRAATYVLQAW